MRHKLLPTGNACLILTEDEQPLLAVDPWLEGSCFFNSWQLRRATPKHHFDLVRAAKFVLFTHGHPDHFHPPTIRVLMPAGEVILPEHFGDELDNACEEIGLAKCRRLRYARPYALSKSVSLILLNDENQDCIVILKGPGFCYVNINDADPRPRFHRIIPHLKKYKPEERYVSMLASPDADCIDIRDESGQSLYPSASKMKETKVRFVHQVLGRLRTSNFICSSFQHRYVHPESMWANAYVADEDYISEQLGLKGITVHLPHTWIDLLTHSVNTDGLLPVECDRQTPEVFVTVASDRLTPLDVSRSTHVFSRVQWLATVVDTVSVDDGVETHIVWDGRRSTRQLRRSVVFKCSANIWRQAIEDGYFDDLLISNRCAVVCVGCHLYPDLAVMLGKQYASGARSILNWARYTAKYLWSDPSAWIRSRLLRPMELQYLEDAKMPSHLSIRIRGGHLSDSRQVSEITRLAFIPALQRSDLAPHQEAENQLTASMGEAAFVEALRSENARTWVACDDEDNVVGFAIASVDDESNRGQINWMALHPAYHGTGTAQALLTEALEWIGEKEIYLSVVHYNERARAFYKKNGFVDAERLASFAVPRILMRRSIRHGRKPSLAAD